MVINISIKLIHIMQNEEQQYLSISTLDEVLQSFSQLQYNQRQLLKKYLCEGAVKTGFIREVLVEEGVSSKKAFLIIQGTATITKKVANGKMVFAQLESLQLVNLQVLIYKRAYYTATVKSSKMKYIQIVQPVIQILYGFLKDSLLVRQKKRKSEIENKLREVSQNESKKQMQQMVDRLSLPALKYFGRESTQEWKKPKSVTSEQREKELKQKKSHSLQKQQSEILIRKQKAQKRSHELRPIQSVMRSESKISTLPNSGTDRNEKIFKEQLKTIIRRKIVYERKQLGVLQAYRQNHNNDLKVIYQQAHTYTQPRENQIDQYFKF